MTRVHATCVAIGGRAVLLLGASGSGKSDLALRLIDRGAVLVSDDQTDLATVAGTVYASAPATIAGLIEVRGVGIVTLPFVTQVPLALAVRLGEPVMRMPETGLTEVFTGVAIPLFRADSYEASATIKVELALKQATDEAS